VCPHHPEGIDESGIIESEEGLMMEHQEIDLERGSEAVNSQNPGDVRRDL